MEGGNCIGQDCSKTHQSSWHVTWAVSPGWSPSDIWVKIQQLLRAHDNFLSSVNLIKHQCRCLISSVCFCPLYLPFRFAISVINHDVLDDELSACGCFCVFVHLAGWFSLIRVRACVRCIHWTSMTSCGLLVKYMSRCWVQKVNSCSSKWWDGWGISFKSCFKDCCTRNGQKKNE